MVSARTRWFAALVLSMMLVPFIRSPQGSADGLEPVDADFVVSEDSVNYYEWFDNASRLDLTGDAALLDGNLTLVRKKAFEDDFNRTDISPWNRRSGSVRISSGTLWLDSRDGVRSSVNRTLGLDDVKVQGSFDFRDGAGHGSVLEFHLVTLTHLIQVKIDAQRDARIYRDTIPSSHTSAYIMRNLNLDDGWNLFSIELVGRSITLVIGSKDLTCTVGGGDLRGTVGSLRIDLAGTGSVHLDDLVALRADPVKGTATTHPIDLPAGHIWDEVWGLVGSELADVSILDARTMEVIPGFHTDMEDHITSLDIQGIPYDLHPSIRIRVEMVNDAFDVPRFRYLCVQFLECPGLWMDSFEKPGSVSVNGWCTRGATRIFANTTLWHDGFDRAGISPWTLDGDGDAWAENGSLQYDGGSSNGSRVTVQRTVDLRDVELSFRWRPDTAGDIVLNVSLHTGDESWVALRAYQDGRYYECLRWDGTDLGRYWGGYQGAPEPGVWKEVDLRSLRGQELDYTIDGGRVMGTGLFSLEGNITSIRFTFERGVAGCLDDVRVSRSHVEAEALSAPVDLPGGKVWSFLRFGTDPSYSGSMHVDVLDARTGEVVPGFHDLYSHGANLSGVDPVQHPSLRLRMHQTCLYPLGDRVVHSLDWWQLWWTEREDVYLETFDDGSGIELSGDLQVVDGRLRRDHRVLRDDFQRLDLDPWVLTGGRADTTKDGLFMRTCDDASARIGTTFSSSDRLYSSVTFTAHEMGAGLSVTLQFENGHVRLSYDHAEALVSLAGDDGHNGPYHASREYQLEVGERGGMGLTVDRGNLSARFDSVKLNISGMFGEANGIHLGLGDGALVTWDRVEISIPDLEGTGVTVPITLPAEDGWLGLELERTYWMEPTYTFSVLDGETLQVIDGHQDLYSGRQVTNLSGIDRRDHPTIRIWFNFTGRYNRNADCNHFRIFWLSQPGQVVQTRAFDTIWMREDVPRENALDLRDHFGGRSVDPGDLRFEAVNVSSPECVLPVLYGPWVSIDLPTEDWNGNATFQVVGRHGDHRFTSDVIHVVVLPVDDPPVLGPLGELDLVEDEVGTFDLGPHLSDVDTNVTDLVVSTDCSECTVDGLALSFLFSDGGFDGVVVVSVEDASSTVDGTLLLHVEAVADAPVIAPLPRVLMMEDESRVFDLSPFVSDEDTPRSRLSVYFEGLGVQEVNGFKTVLRYTRGGNYSIGITVNDERTVVTSVLLVDVMHANDAPTIVALGNYLPPVVIELDEGDQMDLEVITFDADGDELSYILETEWSGMGVSEDGIVSIRTTQGEAGEFEGRVFVVDVNGSSSFLDLLVRVRPVNHPPDIPVILEPLNRSTWRQGEPIRFIATVTDVDLVKGQVLSVEWASNVSGRIVEGTHADSLEVVVSSLGPGTHRIALTVNDGEFTRSAWVELRVLPEVVEPPVEPGGPPAEPIEGGLYTVVLVLVVASIACAFMASKELRSRSDDDPGDDKGR